MTNNEYDDDSLILIVLYYLFCWWLVGVVRGVDDTGRQGRAAYRGDSFI